MKLSIKQSLQSCVHLFTALLFSIVLWCCVGMNIATKKWVSVPICFYNNQCIKIESPEMIMVELIGKRSMLGMIDTRQLAWHIDASNLQEGKQLLKPTTRELLVPEGITMLNCNPANVIINCIRS